MLKETGLGKRETKGKEGEEKSKIDGSHQKGYWLAGKKYIYTQTGYRKPVNEQKTMGRLLQ